MALIEREFSIWAGNAFALRGKIILNVCRVRSLVRLVANCQLTLEMVKVCSIHSAIQFSVDFGPK